MNSFNAFAAEYGFLIKMAFVAVAVIVVGVLLRKRAPEPSRGVK